MISDSRWTALGGWLRRVIDRLGITQRELAAIADTSDRTISALVNAERTNYKPVTLRRLGIALADDPDLIEKILSNPETYSPDDIADRFEWSQLSGVEPTPYRIRPADSHDAGMAAERGEITLRSGQDVRDVDLDEVEKIRASSRDAVENLIRAKEEQLAEITQAVIRERLGNQTMFLTDEDRPTLTVVVEDTPLVVEFKAVTRETERQQVADALGHLLVSASDDARAMEEEPGVDWQPRLLLVTNVPIRAELVEKLKQHGVAHVWPGDWSALMSPAEDVSPRS